MRTLYPNIGLNRISGLFGISRQAVYDHWQRQSKKQLKASIILRIVKSIRSVHKQMGVRKIYNIIKPELDELGIKIGRDGLFNLLRMNGLLTKKRKKYIYTTNSFHHFHKYKNLITNFQPYQANQLWVSDITYLKVNAKGCYLFLTTDAYSRKVVGYEVSRSLEANNAITCLKKAINNASQLEGVIHHSDRGIQYCSNEYVKLLQDNKMKISMTQDSNPLDNSIAERINGILKQEYIELEELKNFKILQSVVEQAIYKYNTLRPHLSIDMKTPNQAHHLTGEIKRKWKSYYKKEKLIL